MRKTLLASLAVVAALCAAQSRVDFSELSPLRKIAIAQMAIEQLYVDSVDGQQLAEGAIRGMLERLDPHSSYSTPKEVKAMEESLRGDFEGIGVQFNMLDDTLLVVQTISGGPSERVGIIAGDRIIAVADTAIAGVHMAQEEIVRRLRGPKGTIARVLVRRAGVPQPVPFTITRDKIPVATLDAAYMIAPRTGYIRLASFGATTHDEFARAAADLQRKGMRHLLLDLTDNGGGYLSAATDLLGELLPAGSLLVYTQGRLEPRREYKARAGALLADCAVTVLVNEFSASAAEIVTGAVQDHDRGQVVGRRTFGKGLVQRPIDLPDRSMIRLTVAHYYTPSGRCIQKPYTKGDRTEYQADLNRRYEHGEMTDRDSIHFADSLRYYTLGRHRTVYGGGGIMPDIFVPLDTARYTPLHRQLSARGLVISAALRYTAAHRTSLYKEYGRATPDDATLNRFQVPQALADSVIAHGAPIDIKPKDEAERTKTRDEIREQLRALVARDLWTQTEYYRIANRRNDIVNAALRAAETAQ